MNLSKLDILRKQDCGNGAGTFAGLIAAAVIACALAGCGGGGGGGSSTGGTGTTGGTGGNSTVTLQGAVTDSATGQPLPNWTVIVENSNPVISSTTDGNGNYSLAGVKASSTVTLDVDYQPPTAVDTQSVTVGTATPQTVNISFIPFGNGTPPPPPP
jgi:hypothetical protein